MLERHNKSSTAVIILAVLSAIVALKLGQDLMAPILTAFVIGVVLAPVADFWTRIGLPAAVAAAFSLLMILAGIIAVVLVLEPPVSDAIARAPIILAKLQSWLESFQYMISGLDQIAGNVSSAVSDDPSKGGFTDNVPVPSLMDAALYAPNYLAQFMIFVGTLYFFLLARKDVYYWMGATVPSLTGRDLNTAEARVSQYFLTITIINACFGVITGTLMTIVGMPSPILWGLLAFLLNYILYLGPISLAFSLLVSGLVVFNSAYAFVPAAVYLSSNAMEGQFVTPSLVGRSMEVNPLLVFLSLIFWLWLWGPIGGFIAIPLLIWAIAVSSEPSS